MSEFTIYMAAGFIYAVGWAIASAIFLSSEKGDFFYGGGFSDAPFVVALYWPALLLFLGLIWVIIFIGWVLSPIVLIPKYLSNTVLIRSINDCLNRNFVE